MFAKSLDFESYVDEIKIIDDTLISERFEIDTDYFHVVDESRLFLPNLMPLRGIRFKEQGLNIITQEIAKVFKKEIAVATVKLDIDRYNLSGGSEVEEAVDKENSFYKKINFNKLKKNEFGAILVNIVNKNEKLMHASTFIYGFDKNNEKYIILIDPYFYFFADIVDQSCFIASMIRYFYKKIKNIKIFAQPERLQRDSNSCSVMAIEMIRQFCINPSLVQEIISQDVKENLKTIRDSNKTTFFKYKLPYHIRKFRQKICQDKEDNILEFQDENFIKKYHKNLLINEIKVKSVTQFNPKNKVYDDLTFLIEKKLNVALVIRAYEYARLLIFLLNRKNKKNKDFEIIDHNTKKTMQFNPSYWLSLIRNPQAIIFDKRKMFKVKQLTKDVDLHELHVQQEEKIVL